MFLSPRIRPSVRPSAGRHDLGRSSGRFSRPQATAAGRPTRRRPSRVLSRSGCVAGRISPDRPGLPITAPSPHSRQPLRSQPRFRRQPEPSEVRQEPRQFIVGRAHRFESLPRACALFFEPLERFQWFTGQSCNALPCEALVTSVGLPAIAFARRGRCTNLPPRLVASRWSATSQVPALAPLRLPDRQRIERSCALMGPFQSPGVHARPLACEPGHRAGRPNFFVRRRRGPSPRHPTNRRSGPP